MYVIATYRILGLSAGKASNYGSYRAMYYNRPRLRFNGMHFAACSQLPSLTVEQYMYDCILLALYLFCIFSLSCFGKLFTCERRHVVIGLFWNSVSMEYNVTAYKRRPCIAGCYISKTVYYRQGENSFDSFYRPFHMVEYFRYLRFYPEGKVKCGKIR